LGTSRCPRSRPLPKRPNFSRKITGQGIEHLQGLEEKGIRAEFIPPKKIESRLVETYDRIKSDMEEMRPSLETSQKALDKEMEDMRKQIDDPRPGQRPTLSG
jgi:hypothetical protein